MYIEGFIKEELWMSIKEGINKMIRRCKLFWRASMQNNVLAIVERPFPAYYYLLYDEDRIMEFHKDALRQVREMLKDFGK